MDNLAQILAQTQEEESQQSVEVLESVTVYFNVVSVIVMDIVETNQTISPMVQA